MSLPVVLANGKTITIEVWKSAKARQFRLVAGIYGIKAIAPTDRRIEELENFLASKKKWILRVSQYYDRLRQRCIDEGLEPNTIYFLGKSYRFQIVKDKQQFVIVSDNLRMITFHVADKRRYKHYIREWYKQQTSRLISERLVQINSKMNLRYNRVSIKNQKSRWGSCSKNRNLNFNLLLAAAPMEVIDYVIIHELVHLVEFGHSKNFWHQVGLVDADYKKHREWLKTYEHITFANNR